ncbi:MAG: DUF262 domain-containing protein [Desulfovibrio sp.]|nr:DUF262 domain-containing protein [Desulfovibrio sp.]
MPKSMKEALLLSDGIDDAVPQELGADGRRAGVEEDRYDDETEYPFDVDKISINPQVVPLTYLLQRLQEKTVSAPPLQRYAGIWDDKRQSRLIESLMLRIPLPLFYVAADTNENWLIVDGLQRITTLHRYISKEEFALSGLEFVDEAQGLKFSELSAKYKNRIRDAQLQFAVVSSSTPAEVQRNIFKRLNTGGLPLTLQEIRHALYYGNSAGLLKTLSESSEFQKATTRSIDNSRMASCELVLRFIAFLIRGVESYPTNDDMDAFLSETMQLLNIMPDLSEKRMQKVFLKKPDKVQCNYTTFQDITFYFKKAMVAAFKIFGDCAFRKSTPLRKVRTPINKALFETVGVILAAMPDADINNLVKNRRSLYKSLENRLGLGEGELSMLISRDSYKKAAIQKRFEIFRAIFSEHSGAKA